MMRNIRIDIEYDGTQYSGWQYQRNAPSIQQAILDAVTQITGEKPRIHGSGRTDAGVHARGQVANFNLEKSIRAPDLKKSMNSLLPDDIRVLGLETVADDFHARYSAKKREYAYYIATRQSAITRHFEWYFPMTLDVAVMTEASQLLMNVKSFGAFCTAAHEVNHHHCDVLEAGWHSVDNRLVFRIVANRFLRGMVRAIVGTLIDVGQHKLSLDQFASLIESGDRSNAGQAAPARGLFLERVYY